MLGRQERASLGRPLGSTPDCRTSPMDRAKRSDRSFYLVEKENCQYLVTVTDTFVETRPLEQPLQGSGFTIDGWHLIKCNYEIAK